MRQVLEERKVQMEDKAVLEKEKAEKQKRERKLEIEAQMSARKEITFANDILKNVDEYEREQIKNDQMQSFLNREKEKQVQSTFEPKVSLKNIVCENLMAIVVQIFL